MDVSVGKPARWGYISQDPPTDLVADVAGRSCLACTGGSASAVPTIPYEQVNTALNCGPCPEVLVAGHQVGRCKSRSRRTRPRGQGLGPGQHQSRGARVVDAN